MAVFLYRMGRTAFRRRWYVALLWVVLLGALGFASTQAASPPEDTGSMPGIESQRAYDLLQKRFPGASQSPNQATARIVFVAPSREKLTSSANRAVIEKLVGEAAESSQVQAVADPFRAGTVNQAASTAYATVTYKAASKDLTDATKDNLRKAVDEARHAGLTVDVGGPVLADDAAAGGSGELIGVVIAAVVLLVTFGSLAAAGLPLLTAVLGVGISTVSIMALGSTLGLSTTSSSLASMLGLAVGIDYALFVVSRYREERGHGHSPQEAAGRAVGTAGSAVVFAGLTVVIALAGLSVVGVPTLTKMGLSAAGAVVVAVLIALTLVPALLGILPNAVLPRRIRKGRDTGARTGDNAGTRWARFVRRRPVPVLLASVIGLGIVALPVLDLQLGMPGDESKSTATTERRAYDELADGFGPGFNGPFTVVVDAKGAKNPKSAAKSVAKTISATKGVVSVTAPVFNPAGNTAIFTATASTAPTDEKTKDLVRAIRAERPEVTAETGATFLVSGTTAINIDVADKMQSALVPYLAVVVGLAFLLLLVIFRSVLVPLKAAFGFLLSVLSALGAVVAVFQWGRLADLIGLQQTGPVMSTMPIMMVGIVFGLAMDYEVFLVSRMREAYTHGERPAEAIVTGFRHSARVVVAAALIMIAVFSGFVGAGLALIKMIGFSLAVAVLFDALVVRMALVPAVMALLGERAWWLPARLARWLPRVDIEGESLSRTPAAETEPAPVAEAAHR
ncbi:MMPL family transporter [Streptomyces sp. NBC_00365]|uniref:MMPL family transporter n=1 Tax=Streptomyces sp. NBC_00365 TaxID=2975726 RepID=UPI0022528B7A|nr:MMPL family transporter [Streptomyces sp. NBC_00365]MCX5097158.1 MMPL family transporter [Streptomyces sp. NBC_00365]